MVRTGATTVLESSRAFCTKFAKQKIQHTWRATNAVDSKRIHQMNSTQCHGDSGANFSIQSSQMQRLKWPKTRWRFMCGTWRASTKKWKSAATLHTESLQVDIVQRFINHAVNISESRSGSIIRFKLNVERSISTSFHMSQIQGQSWSYVCWESVSVGGHGKVTKVYYRISIFIYTALLNWLEFIYVNCWRIVYAPLWSENYLNFRTYDTHWSTRPWEQPYFKFSSKFGVNDFQNVKYCK